MQFLLYIKKDDISMITDSFIVYIRTDNISEDIAEDVKKRFETSNYELNRPKGKS